MTYPSRLPVLRNILDDGRDDLPIPPGNYPVHAVALTVWEYNKLDKCVDSDAWPRGLILTAAIYVTCGEAWPDVYIPMSYIEGYIDNNYFNNSDEDKAIIRQRLADEFIRSVEDTVALFNEFIKQGRFNSLPCINNVNVVRLLDNLLLFEY